jgi:(1->4)-alpha-D-glucan 1-alpha-D-glucosylmutase
VVAAVRSAPATGTVTLPDGPWRDEITGAVVDGGPTPLAGLLDRFPVAVLVRR